MSEFDAPPSQTRPLRAVLRYWPISLAIALLGLSLGIGVGSTRAPTYTAEVRLAIGGQNLTSYAIPGFALAAQELAADYARFVSLPQDETTLKAALGARAGAVTGLDASPIPNSSVVSIEAQAQDRALAMSAATAVGAALITAVNGQTNDQVVAALLAQYNTLSDSVAQASVALQEAQNLVTKLDALTTATPLQISDAEQAVVTAQSKFASLSLQQSALGSKYQTAATSDTPSSDLSVVQPAAIILSNKTKNEELYGLMGLAGGGAIALIFASLRARRNHRKQVRAAAAAAAAAVPAPKPIERQPVFSPKAPRVGKDAPRVTPTPSRPGGGRSGETVGR